MIELGANIHATARIGTPLHSAAYGARVKSVELLLAAGAAVDAKNEPGLTPLELLFESGTNAQLVEMLACARLLLGAGARRTRRTKSAVTELGKRYEFHRGNIADDIAVATSDALDELYVLFDVPPVPRREHHDGKSPIVPKSETWQQQHAELWNLLVPSSGPAETVQGELIRIAGKVARELAGNGAVNWGPDWVSLARAFGELLGRGVPLAGAERADAEAIVTSLVERADCDIDRMAQLAVAWVLANPQPQALGRIDYKI